MRHLLKGLKIGVGMKKTILLIAQITFFIFLYSSYAFAEPAKIISVYVQRERKLELKLSEKNQNIMLLNLIKKSCLFLLITQSN